MATKDFWANAVAKTLKTEFLKRDLTYNNLKDKLAEIGIEESETNIKNKLSRGTFSAIFFLQCLRAIGIKTLQLDETIFEEQNKK